jgi:hypothetical protein
MPSDREIKKSESLTDSYPGERRRSSRFPFLADFEGFEPKSNIRIDGRVSDIGSGGCYVEMINPLPEGTLLRIHIRKEKECFTAKAKVASSQMHMGMGLVFVSAAQDDVILFQKWLGELSGVVPTRRAPPVSATPGGSVARATVDAGEVLGELFVLLTRKGVLTEEEGDSLLRKLRP